MLTEKQQLTRRAFLAISAAATLALKGGEADATVVSPAELNMWIAAREMVADGMLGTPYYVSVRVSRDRCSEDLTHVMRRIDAVVSSGTAVSVIPIGYDPAKEDPPDHFMIAARYPDGLACTIDVDIQTVDADTYVIRGESGSLHLYDTPNPHFEFQDERDRPKLIYHLVSRTLA